MTQKMNINTYLKTFTLPDSGKSKVSDLVTLAIKGSPALEVFDNVTLTAKESYIPILRMPKATDTSFVVDGVTVVKELINAKGDLVDESIEDATPNLEEAMDSALKSQLRIKIESKVAGVLAAVGVVSGASSKSVATVIETLKKFDEAVFLLEGQFVVFVSYTSYLTIMSTLTLAEKKLMDDGLFTVKPMVGLPDTSMVVLHTYGAKLGYRDFAVERDRFAEAQKTTIIAPGSVGFGIDSAYVKHIKLS